MTKIRNVEDLNTLLDEDLTWRKQELAQLMAMLSTEKSNSARGRVLMRSNIALLYAHWEGFIKKAGSLYLEYVASQKLNYNQLKSNFLALAFKKKLEDVEVTKRYTAYSESLDFIRSQLDQRSRIPYRDVIRTESNLSSSVFKEIVLSLGLDYSVYETKQKLIDGKLLAKRNKIAHGEYLDLDLRPEDYEELYQQVLGMMNDFKNQVTNHACQGLYRIS